MAQKPELSKATACAGSISPVPDVGFGFPVPQAELHPSGDVDGQSTHELCTGHGPRLQLDFLEPWESTGY